MYVNYPSPYIFAKNDLFPYLIHNSLFFSNSLISYKKKILHVIRILSLFSLWSCQRVDRVKKGNLEFEKDRKTFSDYSTQSEKDFYLIFLYNSILKASRDFRETFELYSTIIKISNRSNLFLFSIEPIDLILWKISV